MSQDPTDANSVVDLSDASGVGAKYAPFAYATGRSFESSRTGIATLLQVQQTHQYQVQVLSVIYLSMLVE